MTMARVFVVFMLVAGCAATPPTERAEPVRVVDHLVRVVDHAPSRCLGLHGATRSSASFRLVASLDKQPIRRAFERHRPGFRCCYAQQQGRDLSAEGKAVIELELLEGRVVSASSDVEGSLDGNMSDCVRRVAREITIPEWLVSPSKDAIARPRELVPSRLGTRTPPDPRHRPKEPFRVHIRYPLLFVSRP